MKPDGHTGHGLNTASQLLSRPVCTGSGELVGHVDDLLVNPDSGKVQYLVVRPRVSDGSVCVRLTWKDIRVDDVADCLTLVPGSTAVKRLLLKTAPVEPSEGTARPLH